MNQKEQTENCSFLRRMGAILYDTLLVFSVLLFATIPYMAFTGGEAVNSGDRIFQGYLILITVLYFVLPWKIRGQTLGMQSWKIKLVQKTGVLITWRQAIGRIMASVISWVLAGMGFLWSIFDRDKKAWHDGLSGTKLIHFIKEKK